MKIQNCIRKTSIGMLFLLLALSAALIHIAQPHAAGFSDVPQNHWAATAISPANADGIMTGRRCSFYRREKAGWQCARCMPVCRSSGAWRFFTNMLNGG